MRPVGQQIRKLRGLSHTWRFNYHPRIRQESVAEHSYWVALIVSYLMISKGKLGEAAAYAAAALFHDAEEAVTGDLPSPVKRGRAWKDVEEAALDEIVGDGAMVINRSAESHKFIKMADTVSALLVADEEVKMGNTMFAQIRGELIKVAYGYMDMELSQMLDEMGFHIEEGREFIKEMSHL
jgi:5'-deoxynucleotidase